MLPMTLLMVSIHLFYTPVHAQLDTMHYQDGLKLEEKHFKAVTPNSALYAIHKDDLGGHISLDIVTEGRYYLDSANVFVYAVMYCDKSWILRNNIVIEEALEHELYHFKITEICARRYRKKLCDMMYIKGTFHEIECQIKSEHRELNKIYDLETQHGVNVSEQVRWQTIIDRQLSELQMYASPLVKLKYAKNRSR
jgi:hypothetical protein